MASSLSLQTPGLNEVNRGEEFVFISNDSVNDGADITITLPERFRGKSYLPTDITVANVASGTAAGSMVLTMLNEDDGAGTGVTRKSYTQSTGVLLLTNNMGVAMTRYMVHFRVVEVPFVAAPN